MANEGKELIRKRQKRIRIADKSADSWKVVDEYVSDELASGSEDEKRLKEAKEASSRKRRHSLKFCLITLGVLCLFSRLLGFARDPPVSYFAWFLRLFKR